MLQQLQGIVDEARQDWILQVEDSITWTRETSVTVRLAELDHQIRNDLEGMLGQEDPRDLRKMGSRAWSMTILRIGGLFIFVGVKKPLSPSERYSAANDTPVTVFERVKVRVKMPLYEGSSYLGMVPVMVTGVVADVSHNIECTGHKVAAGWEVKLSKDEISLRRLKGNLVGYGSSWSGCPWIYLVADVSHNILSTGHMVAAGWEVKLSKDEISLRRLKGNLVGYGSSWSGCPWIYLEGHDQPKKKGNLWKDSSQDGCR